MSGMNVAQNLLDSILLFGNQQGARDYFLMANEYPIFQIGSESRTFPGETPKITPDHLKAIVEETIGKSELLKENLQKKLYTEFSHVVQGVGRYRFHVGYQRSHFDISIRRLLDEVPSFEELNLPGDEIKDLAELHNGLVLISGAADNGKSTTLAALIDYINQTKPGRRITIVESPREFFFRNNQCYIKQKEIGRDTISYNDAARSARRENTNVLVFGEIFSEDASSVRAAIQASNSALVFATMHANSASAAINGLIYSLPDVEREESRLTLSQLLRAVIYQVLVKTYDETLWPCLELLRNNYMVSSLIRNKECTDDGKPFKIDEYLFRNGRTEGMKSLFHALKDLVEWGIIPPEEAIKYAREKRDMELTLLHGHFSGITEEVS